MDRSTSTGSASVDVMLGAKLDPLRSGRSDARTVSRVSAGIDRTSVTIEPSSLA